MKYIYSFILYYVIPVTGVIRILPILADTVGSICPMYDEDVLVIVSDCNNEG